MWTIILLILSVICCILTGRIIYVAYTAANLNELPQWGVMVIGSAILTISFGVWSYCIW